LIESGTDEACAQVRGAGNVAANRTWMPHLDIGDRAAGDPFREARSNGLDLR
jgi:hypothetical protein